jgi:hypothetical protein
MAQGIVRPQDIVWGGASFPASPATDDRWFRTDLGFDCYYDGTRWLTVQEYPQTLQTLYLAVLGYSGLAAPRIDCIKYFTRLTVIYYAYAPNDASNYWTIDFYGANAAFGAFTIIHTFTTAAATPATNLILDTVPSDQLPTNQAFLFFAATPTLAPGPIQTLGAVAYYRLVVT